MIFYIDNIVVDFTPLFKGKGQGYMDMRLNLHTPCNFFSEN